MEKMSLFGIPLKTLIVAIIGLIGAIIGGSYNKRGEQQKTARIIFDKSYSKIFTIIEHNLYKKDLSLIEIQELASRILIILNNANGYYYPSLHEYVIHMISTTDLEEARSTFDGFCWTFDRQYEKISYQIGIPRRSRYYRMNTHQYRDNWHLLKIYVFSKYIWRDILNIILIVGILAMIYIFDSLKS